MRLLLAFAATSVTAMALVAACSKDTTSKPAATTDASTDAGEEQVNPTRDANGPGKAGDDCVFNDDCQLVLRCGACDAGTCVCENGARGTGRNGIDRCDAGEQCTSALCVEGPGDSGVSYCSDECASSDDCTGVLPTCVSVPFFGDFCARDGG
jgi:hypothetical protein